MRLPKLLFFEPDFRGHQADYLTHLCQYALRARVPAELHFVVHPSLFAESPSLQSRFHRPAAGLHLTPLPDREAEAMQSGGLVGRDWVQWTILRRWAAKLGVDHAVSMKIDQQLLSLALHRSAPPGCAVSGILFRTAIHYEPPPDRGLAGRARDAAKGIAYRSLLQHPAVRHVFSLDPYFPDFASRHLPNGFKVSSLPDPVLRISPDDSALKSLGLDDWGCGRRRFLLFGYLSARKGVRQLLDALDKLPSEAGRRAAVLLAGRVDPAVRAELDGRLATFEGTEHELQLRVVDRFLPGPTLASLIERCDVVLAPYQAAVGSSGVLLWAAGARKPVLTQEYGLIGRWVAEHGLGLAVDTTDSSAIAAALARFIMDPEGVPYSNEGAAALTRRHTPEQFAATLLGRLIQDGG